MSGEAPAAPRPAGHLPFSPESVSQILRSSPIGISISRVRDGLIVDMNDEFLRILGFAREEAVGRTSEEVGLWVTPRQREEVIADFRARGRSSPRAIPMRRKDGTVVTILFSLSPVALGDEPHAIAWVMDITERLRTEEALRASEETWRTLAENAPVTILTVDRAGTILTFSRSLVGRDRREVIGRCLHDFPVGPEERERSVALLHRVFSEGRTVNFEIDVLKPAGGRVRMRNVLAPLRSGGEITAAIGVGMDITERHEAVEALRASETRWRSLAENAPVVILTLDRDGTILSINRTITGRPVEEYRGRRPFDFLHPAYRERGKALIASVIATGRPATGEYPILRPDGSPHWFQVSIAPLAPGTAPERAILVATDINARRRAEEALRESEQRFADIVRSLGEWVWETDAGGRVTYSSPQVEQVLGYRPEEMLGRSPFDTAAPEEIARLEIAFSGFTGNPRLIRDFEAWYLHKDGHRVCLSSSGVPMLGPGGELRGFRGVVHDVTDRKREEEEHRRMEDEVHQARRVESLGMLAGGIAHDFNNLLTAILGNADIALATLAGDSEVRPLLGQIQTAAVHAAELTRQMLAYAGRGRFATRRVDVSATVREMSQLLAASVPKGVELAFDLADALPVVEADPAQVRQVIMNLVLNAAEASVGGTGRVAVRTAADGKAAAGSDIVLGAFAAGRESVMIEVADNGGGMDRETLKRIFDPFFTTKFTGRGLGLAAVQGIVLRHGGALSVSSLPGTGSVFRVFLPAAGPPGSAAAAPPASAPSSAPWRGNGTVLVVDDEEPVRTMAARMLRAIGFEAVTAAGGPEAVALIGDRGEAVRAVLLDLTMPHMDGRETFRELRRRRADLPVILCSGYDVLESATRFSGLDFGGFLQKPYRIADLTEALHRVLGG
jgi:PAS domain S-box-containing protein